MLLLVYKKFLTNEIHKLMKFTKILRTLPEVSKKEPPIDKAVPKES